MMPPSPLLAQGPAGPVRPTRVRHLVIFVTMLAAVLLYLDRFCVSIAADYIREDLGLTQNEMGWFLSAFFWSYALAQVPSGWLSDRYGARVMLAIYVLSWSFFTGMIGAATSLLLLLVMRFGCGLGQAGAYPTSAGLISKWVPFGDRGLASSVVAFGGRVGGFIAPLLTAHLVVMFVPLDVPATLAERDLLDGGRLSAKLAPWDNPPNGHEDAKLRLTQPAPAGKRIWPLLPPRVRQDVIAPLAARYRALEAQVRSLEQDEQEAWLAGVQLPWAGRDHTAGPLGAKRKELAQVQLSPSDRGLLVASFNDLLEKPDLFGDDDFRYAPLAREAIGLLERKNGGEPLTQAATVRLNRLLLEGLFREEIRKLYVRGWRPVMYVYGAAGILVAGLFWILFRNRPEQHPWSNQGECDLVAAGRPAGAPGPHGRPGMVPLGRLLKSRSMWFCCLSQIGTNIGWVFLVTWLPRYLMEVHQVPILERGFMAGIPLAVGIVGMLAGGKLTDALVRMVGLRWGRRYPMMLTRFTGAAGYGLCLWFALVDSWLNSPWMFTLAFSLVAFSTDLGNPATWAFNQDVGGRYVGSVLGWGNMWGNLGAALAPPVYDLVLGETPSLADWNWMFAVCLGAFLFSGFCTLGVDASVAIAPGDEEHQVPDAGGHRERPRRPTRFAAP